MSSTNLYYLAHINDVHLINNNAKQILDPKPVKEDGITASFLRLKNGDFQVMQMGNFRPIMDGLMQKELFLKLKDLVPNQINGKPTKVVRRATSSTWDNYYEVSFSKFISPYIDPNYTTTDDEIINYAGFIYVSESLAKKLKQFISENFENYFFTQNFPLFAG